MPSEPRYSVKTWDTEAQAFTPQDGMSAPSINVSLWGLRRALQELRRDWGYDCYYVRASNGEHCNDPSVLVEKVN